MYIHIHTYTCASILRITLRLNHANTSNTNNHTNVICMYVCMYVYMYVCMYV